MYQHLSGRREEDLLGGLGGGAPPGQNNGIHVQLQVNISEPIWIILAVPQNSYFFNCPGKTFSVICFEPLT